MTSSVLSSTDIRDLYAKMLLARTVALSVQSIYAEHDALAMHNSSYGYEATQIGSAACIQVGTDFTLPTYHDPGVMLSIGMTPYEIFRSHLQACTLPIQNRLDDNGKSLDQRNWSYHKHNTITSPTSIATQLLQGSGIAFASKLRKAPVVTVAYCDDQAIRDADCTEAFQFAALHQLPIVFVYEHDKAAFNGPTTTCSHRLNLPDGLLYEQVDGANIIAVYCAMQNAMQHARTGKGPVLLEMAISSTISNSENKIRHSVDQEHTIYDACDPLYICQKYLEEQGKWGAEWAEQIATRIKRDTEQALQNAYRDTPQIH